MIIGDGIVLGSGGESASIIVTGLSETDSVTATYKIPAWVVNTKWKYLPNDYTQLEYIESTGTQFIDTEVIPSVVGYKAEVGFCATSVPSSGESWILAAFQSGSANWRCGFSNGSFYTSGGFSYSQSSTTADTVADGTNTMTPALSLYLFSQHESSGAVHTDNSKYKLYYCNISNGDNALRKFIPAKRNSDSVIGLYDLVSNTFFTNAGTGTFIAGSKTQRYIKGYVDGKTIVGKWANIQKSINVQVPTMTSNTSPSGECSASGYRSGCPAYKAFDNSDNAWVVDVVPTSSNPQWIQYKFEEPVCVTSMMYKMGDNDNSRVRNCVIQCSEDGDNFTDVYSTDIPTSPAEVTVTFENTIFAKYWRLKILSNNGNTQNVYVMNLQFYGTKISDVYGHILSPIKSYGTWTVTASNGTNTRISDVLIDSASEYKINMPYILWLYNGELATANEKECKDVTGGWSGYNIENTGTIQKNSDNLYIGISGSYKGVAISTINAFNVKGFKKLYAVVDRIENNGGNSIGLWTKKPDTRNMTDGLYCGIYNTTATGKPTISVDIPDTNQELYAAIVVGTTTNGGSPYVRLYKMWLE